MPTSTKIPINDLSRTQNEEVANLTKCISGVVASGILLNGENVRFLESVVCQYLNFPASLGVSNGSDALYLALSALGIGDSYEVLTVGNSAGYATNAILRCGAKSRLVDVESDTSQMSKELLETSLEEFTRVRAVIVTHLYGFMAKMPEISELCRTYGVMLIEDCAQAFGARLEGVSAGAWGDAATFSFYPTKNLAALGDGGMVAFKDSEACDRARKIAQYGWSSRYEVELPDGINSRLDEIQAAVVLHRLGSVDSRNSRRRDILRRYAEAVTMPRRFIFEDSERCVAHLAVMRTPTRDRDRKILNNHRIDTAIHYPIPDHHQPAWRHLFEGVDLPNTEAHCAEVLTLPCFPELTEEEILRVCEALKSL